MVVPALTSRSSGRQGANITCINPQPCFGPMHAWQLWEWHRRQGAKGYHSLTTPLAHIIILSLYVYTKSDNRHRLVSSSRIYGNLYSLTFSASSELRIICYIPKYLLIVSYLSPWAVGRHGIRCDGTIQSPCRLTSMGGRY